MKIGSAFPSKYIKHEDLQGKKVIVTMDHVEVEDVGQGDQQERKPVLYMVGSKKGLVLNRTNADSIVDLIGTDDTDEWHGKKIILTPAKTTFGGKKVNCIRIEAASNGQPRPEPEVVEGLADDEGDDPSVPF